MPRVTIIETGIISPQQRDRHGSFPQMFQRMIGAADSTITFDVVSVVADEPLPDPAGLEAILITGSPAGVYDKFEWIAPLEDFVRAAYAGRTPMAGICFGHQLMAQALGGIVRKSDKGWGIGRHVYDIAPGNGVIDGEHIALACSHQDQVLEPPRGASTFMSSDFTPHAGLLYGNGAALSVQPHPEFSVGFAHLCCDMREGKAPDDVVAAAKASLQLPLESDRLGAAIARFLSKRALSPPSP
ncbi:MAG TPA: type 1 glutamine amidotransferase [Bradyrhizobium sp.]|nr:type 1 glutamine amidotransferase [Bradyrhizobium sp.]